MISREIINFMKKALIFGGSNGLGAAIIERLALLYPGIEITDVDCVPPSYSKPVVSYVQADFAKGYGIAGYCFEDADIVIYTAGIGRLDHFEDFAPAETRRYWSVNTQTPIELIEHFSKRLLSDRPFYLGVVTSIAAQVGSPFFAIYSASKAALAKYIEAVDTELEGAGHPNRILDYCPGFIKGSRFYGLANQPAELEKYAGDFLDALQKQESWRLALNDPTYINVIKRYQDDPHRFDLDSYQYKQASGRMNPNPKLTVGYMSGTFDLFHIGHLNILKNAKTHCDYLVVGVHTSGKFKGKETFIPLNERKAIVEAISYVDEVIDAPDDDIDYVLEHQPDFLFVGGDYKGSERFNRYEEILKDKKTKIVYFPYTKGTSSTKLREALDAIKKQ
jgi:glycerol-3-phosphate cytidylyltransferase